MCTRDTGTRGDASECTNKSFLSCETAQKRKNIERVATRLEVAGVMSEDEHLIRFAVQPVPGLSLELQPPSPSSDDVSSDLVEFTLTGPPEALSTLRTAAGLGPEERLPPSLRTGLTSPINPITLTTGDIVSSSVANKIQVPEGSKSFGFSYPFHIDASMFAKITNLLSAGCESGAYVQPEWLNFLLVGGYVYFDADRKLLGANALSPRGEGTEKAGVELVLVGPYDCAVGAGEAMRTAGRLQKVTIGSLKGAGFEEFGWVFKGEEPGGHALGPEHKQGAFVYRHVSADLYLYYQLWMPKGEPSAQTDKKIALDRAMRSNFARADGASPMGVRASAGAPSTGAPSAAGASSAGAPSAGAPAPQQSNLSTAEQAAKHKAELKASGMSDELIQAILAELLEEKEGGKKANKRGFGGRAKQDKPKSEDEVDLDVKGGGACCALQ